MKIIASRLSQRISITKQAPLTRRASRLANRSIEHETHAPLKLRPSKPSESQSKIDLKSGSLLIEVSFPCRTFINLSPKLSSGILPD